MYKALQVSSDMRAESLVKLLMEKCMIPMDALQFFDLYERTSKFPNGVKDNCVFN